MACLFSNPMEVAKTRMQMQVRRYPHLVWYVADSNQEPNCVCMSSPSFCNILQTLSDLTCLFDYYFSPQGELAQRGGARAYNNALHCLYKVFKDEGIRGIQKGLGAGIIYQVRTVT